MAALKALVAFMVVAAIADLAAAKSYTINWELKQDYSDWSSKNAVTMGDSITFNYATVHTVDELSKDDYSACSFSNSISSDNSGKTTITIDKAGTRYFACATAHHCIQGQRIAIQVKEAASPPSGESPPNTTPPSPKTSAASPSKANSMALNNLGLVTKIIFGVSLGGFLLAAF